MFFVKIRYEPITEPFVTARETQHLLLMYIPTHSSVEGKQYFLVRIETVQFRIRKLRNLDSL